MLSPPPKISFLVKKHEKAPVAKSRHLRILRAHARSALPLLTTGRKLSSTAPTLGWWCKARAWPACGGAWDRADRERAARTNRGPAVSVEVCLAGRAKEA